MKKVLSLLLACVSTLAAIADDGGTLYPENWTYGNIYVKEPNQSIALEKEYMYVSGDRIEAVFCFRNTTDSTVVVPCAFPIVISMPFRVDNDTVIVGDYNRLENANLWRIALDREISIVHNESLTHQLDMSKRDLEKCDKKLRVLTYSDYESLYRQGIADEKDAKYYKGCNIMQDGKHVELKNVGLETNIKFRKNSNKYEFESAVELTLHFYHELKFEPNSLSYLFVEYNIDVASESYIVNSYDVYYDISTGGTWKDGTIGSFVLLTDYLMKEVKGLQSTRIIPYYVYSAKNYKPTGRFHFHGDDEESNKMYERKFPGREYPTYNYKKVERIYLPKINREMELWGIKNESAESFFPFTIDSAICFKIRESCLGPFVANGFVDVENLERNSALFEKEYSGRDPEMFTLWQDSIWGKYSRIKTAKLSNIDEGWEETLQLEDRFPAYPYEVNSNFNDGWYGSNSVRNVKLLQPGKYKFEITDTYKGDSTTAVGVSHIWFYPVDATLISIIDEDAQSEKPLFADVWNKLFAIQHSNEELLLGDAEEAARAAQKAYEEALKRDSKNGAKTASVRTTYSVLEYTLAILILVLPLAIIVTIIVLIIRRIRRRKRTNS